MIRFFLMLSLVSVSPAPAAELRRVLIIHSFGRDFAPLDTMSAAFRTELARQSPEPVEFYESSIETARFAEVGNEGPLLDYLKSLFAERRLDLILAVAEPATFFCVRHRAELFPKAPLLALVDHRQIPIVTASSNATIVPVWIKIPVLMENILQILPATTNVFMILGASPMERYWAEQCRREFAVFANRVTISYANDLPLERIRERIGTMPPNSAILYAMLAVDAAGVPYEQEKALASLRTAANAPLFGVFESHLGNGIIGGPLLSLDNSGRQAARTALRLIHGEEASKINIPPPESAKFIYDWRVLKRWNINPDRLPSNSEIRFHPPSLWQDHKKLIVSTTAVIIAQMLTIAGLLVHRAQRRRSEAALTESEQRLKLAADAAKIGIWVWDIPRDVVWTSEEGRRLFGWGKAEAVNFERFIATLNRDDREPTRRAVQRALDGLEDYQAEYRVLLADGTTRWLAARGRVEFNGERKPARLRGVSLDITERRRAEEKFRLAVEASPSAIVMVNGQGEILLINALTEKVFGYSREELVGQSIELLVPERFRALHPKHRANFFAAPQARAMGAGRELFARRKDGSEFPVEIGLNPIRTEEGVLVICSILDISERLKTMVELDRHRQELAHVSRVSIMGELSASMAHELNQPLTAILTNAQAGQRFLAAGEPDLAEFREILKDIAYDTARARDVIRHLRALVKKSEPDFTRVDLNETIREVVGFLHGDIVARNVRVVLRLEPDLSAIHGDRIQLQQVLINLLLNAFDAMNGEPVPERCVTVSTAQDSSRIVHATVRDCGTGIPEDKLERIFDPFYTTKREGMGMGLSVTRSIIESHGGRISAENHISRGALFHFTLRVAE